MTGVEAKGGLAAGVVATAAVASMGLSAYAAHRDLRRHPLPGELVDIGGYRLHVRTTGRDAAGPTVVFEAGLSCPLEGWAWVQDSIGASMPTVSYDRAGLGGSDRGPRARTTVTMVEELRRLLGVLEVPPPFVLVGHSFGGLLVRAYASRYPAQVGGMVLVDASHPDQLERSASQRAGLPVMRMQLAQTATSARLGTLRLTNRYMLRGIEALPSASYARARARVVTSKSCRTACAEVDGWLSDVNPSVRNAELPPDLPLSVVTAGAVVKGDSVHDRLQADLAGLAADSDWRCVPDADHLGLIMNESFAAEVTGVVRETVARTRLGGTRPKEPPIPKQLEEL